jgi:catechol 2,3-dioxygenase-like lactoylglutathione lyase family enzyme
VLPALDPICFVHTTDVAKAKAFYSGILGFEILEESPHAIAVRAGRTMIRITPNADHVASSATVLGWTVPVIGAVVADLVARGVTFVRYDGMNQNQDGVRASPSGAQIAWFRDPDGNVLSLTEF